MVHALREIHRSLRPRGVLLDIHPQMQHPSVEVHREGRAIAVGTIDWTEDNREIRGARTRLARLERDGLFRTKRRVRFDMLARFRSVDGWLRYRAERAYSSPVPADTVRRARREMARGGELVTRTHIRGSRLRRLG